MAIQNAVTPTQNAAERSYYLIRSCRSIPLECGVVGYGWDDIRFCDFSAEEIIKEIIEVKRWPIGRQANQIRRFKGIREGDVVVVPYWGGAVAIGIAQSEELYDPTYSKNEKEKWSELQIVISDEGEAGPVTSSSEKLKR